MTVYLVNNDPFGNKVKVIDKNAGDALLFDGYIAEHATQEINNCRKNASGYGNISTSQDNGPWNNRSLLNEGQEIIL